MTTMRFALAAVLALAALPAFAGHEHSRKEIRLLNDSAAALQSTHPELSSKLKSYASIEKGESDRSVTDRPEDIQMLRDCAAALESKKPSLARDLRRLASKEEGERRLPIKIKPAERAPAESPTGY